LAPCEFIFLVLDARLLCSSEGLQPPQHLSLLLPRASRACACGVAPAGGAAGAAAGACTDSVIFLDYHEELYYAPGEPPAHVVGPRGTGRGRVDVRAVDAALRAGALPLSSEDSPSLEGEGQDPAGLSLEGHDVTEAEVGGRCGCAHAEGTMGEALRVGGRHIRAELNCDGIHMGPAALGPLARSLRAVGVCHGVAL
jgi:hypothetical protein